MLRKKHLLFLLPVILVALSACGPAPTLRSEEFLVDDSLLTGEPCEAPCWNGIIPGETLYTEAVETIRGDQNVNASTFREVNEGGVFSIQWARAGSELLCCQIVARVQDGPVSLVSLLLTPDIVVGEVVERYGEPAYTFPGQFTETEVILQMIYPEQRMTVMALIGEPTASLLASTEVVAVLYLSQEEMDLILQTSELQAWLGYQSYASYSEATPVVTPSITLTPAPEGE